MGLAWQVAHLDMGRWPWFFVGLFAVMTAACITSLIMILVRRHRHKDDPAPVPERTPETDFQAGFTALTDAERDTIRLDFRGALDILVEAGIVSKGDKAAAISSGIGGFANWRQTRSPYNKRKPDRRRAPLRANKSQQRALRRRTQR